MSQPVWEIAIQQDKTKPGARKRTETTIIFAGNKGSGKSTIINRFLERNESPKPTLALDYTYGRKGVGNFLTRAVSHIWELGGGLKLSDLLGVVITPNNILSLHLILVIDLSKPEELWDTIDTLLKSVSGRIDQMLDRLYQKNVTRIQNIFKENLRNRIPSNHPDIELLNPFPLPLTVLGTKYDILMAKSAEQQNLIYRTIRFLSHFYGASVYFCSVKDDGLLKKIKAYLSHIAFDSKNLFDVQMETGKPLMIPVGVDSFSNIGTPMNVDMEIERLTVKSPLEMWKNVFCSKFPQKSGLTTSFGNIIDPSKDLQYSEPLVDSARKIKHDELESKLHQNERHMLNLLQQITSEGIIIA
ncbi:Cytoplasmic dynein 2 light intermediate chain 1 isoform 2 [Schistosoma japonicum]|uniref:Cytoplasmic dynein 2 light intermediate chain 1 n=1 Tax=Schistosoma japonicum TaxID=6182 RepID=A0A4Z2D6M5_SCHJA|nr:Cytoplasmic dynein 2 light intermediate chain 1 isoform 2 [Schistosoma japonicum]